MGRLIVSEFVTLDGIMEAPGFEEHRSGRNAWALRLSDDDMQRYRRQEIREAAAALLGRTSYQIWAAFWPSLKDDEAFGRRMNDVPKYVVSSTLMGADWVNSTILPGDVGTEVAALKRRIEGEIVVNGSADLVAELMKRDLVDEYRLLVFAGVSGSGKRLFDDENARAEVERWHGQLVKTTGDGVLARFDAPTRALRCAFALHGALAALGREIRAAIHTGEVELRGHDVGGIGIHIAARALEEAGGRAVVVTRTVRDLATGTDLSFEPLGAVGMRGVPGNWELFEASIR